jgi:lipoic acid synthetase
MMKDAPEKTRFPPWIKKRIPSGGAGERVRELLSRLRLATVCQSAHCPNLCECFARGTATFMILGTTCTRRCGFCAVPHGACAPPDPAEPARVAAAAAALELSHVVVTSVTRDDLPDGGAEQFRQTVLALAEKLPSTIEVLTPDFRGDLAAAERVASAHPHVYNHNVETAPHLYAEVRPQADYPRSLALLRHVKDRHPELRTKSGLMVGLGETPDEVLAVLANLREAGCEMVTIGQYLRPSPRHLPVREFVTPEQFAVYQSHARAMGFAAVASGPFVRSSYRADAMCAATISAGDA